MAVLTTKFFLYARYSTRGEFDGFSSHNYQIANDDHGKYGWYIPVGEKTVEFDIPDRSPDQEMVELLRKEMDLARAELAMKITQMQSAINNLLALSHSEVLDPLPPGERAPATMVHDEALDNAQRQHERDNLDDDLPL